MRNTDVPQYREASAEHFSRLVALRGKGAVELRRLIACLDGQIRIVERDEGKGLLRDQYISQTFTNVGALRIFGPQLSQLPEASFQRFLRFTTAMFVVPLATMTVAFMVLEPLVAKPADRMVYAGVAAIVAVQAVIVAFLVSAWNEDDVPMPAKPAPPVAISVTRDAGTSLDRCAPKTSTKLNS